jgi:hypothetical protein
MNINADPDDITDFLCDVEEEFGIEFEYLDATATPGTLADYVIAHIPTSGNAACHSQAAFYRLRSVLTKYCGIPRDKIHPHSPLSDLIKDDIPGNWEKLKKNLKAGRLPRLESTWRFIVIVDFVIPLAIASFFWVMGLDFGMCGIIFLALLAVNMLGVDGGTLIPERFQTIGDLIPYIPYASLSHSVVQTRETVLERIIFIARDCFATPQEKISEDSMIFD